ncbi:MAG: coenzyme F420-0:L-glutamate ligase [Euryarchaeota archaeon]|nr:coenzyme F420-0:L-glutamate ligase [Euryarchaeota archaeon]
MEIIGLDNLPLIRDGDDLVEIISSALKEKGIALKNNDIVAVTEKIVAKAEGRLVDLDKVKPSRRAVVLGRKTEKDPRIVELILRESKEILAVGKNFIIVETKQGFICANAGVDQSNVEKGKAKLLPRNPDRSAKRIRKGLEEKIGKKIGVIIADSFGRPFRYGTVGIAIGASGIKALWDRRGDKDLFGRELQITRVAVADCLASAANMVMGEAKEKIPIAIIRGLNFSGSGKARDLIRKKREDVFR